MMMQRALRFSALVALATAFLLPGTNAGALTIDFSGFGHGDVIADPAGSLGIATFTVTNTGGGPDIGAIFDTERLSDPNDPDLLRQGPAGIDGVWDGGNLPNDFVFGNALIIQQNSSNCATGTCSDPNDEAGGGIINITFAMSVTSFGLDVIDIDDGESEGGLTFYDGGDSQFFSWASLVGAGNIGDNFVNEIAPITIEELGFTNIDRVSVELISSGAIDNLMIMPEPGTALLLALGLLGVATARRP
jgi:hypothetical protein